MSFYISLLIFWCVFCRVVCHFFIFLLYFSCVAWSFIGHLIHSSVHCVSLIYIFICLIEIIYVLNINHYAISKLMAGQSTHLVQSINHFYFLIHLPYIIFTKSSIHISIYHNLISLSVHSFSIDMK